MVQHSVISPNIPHKGSLDSTEKANGKNGSSRFIHIRSENVDTEKANWKQRFCFLHMKKRKGFILLSFIFCFFHTGILCNDIIAHTITESFLTWSYSYTVTLLMSHVVSFYWALLGSIYSLQSGVKSLCLLALASAVLNFWVFLGRTWFEFIIIKFRDEIY